MSKLIKSHWPFLQLLMKSESKHQAQVLVQTISNNQLRALLEIIANVLVGNIPITKSYKKLLAPNKKAISLLADKTVSVKDKKQIIAKKLSVIINLLKAANPVLQHMV